MAEYTDKHASHLNTSHGDVSDHRNQGRSSKQRQGQKHYYTKPFPLLWSLVSLRVLYGGIHWLNYLLHFSIVPLGFWQSPFQTSVHLHCCRASDRLAVFIVFSIVAALIYTYTLRKWKGPLPGIGYGIVWWLIIFVLVGPKLDMVKPINRLTWDSIITEFCFFCCGAVHRLYGSHGVHGRTETRARESGSIAAKSFSIRQ